MGYLALPGPLQAGQGLSLPCWMTAALLGCCNDFPGAVLLLMDS
jgi:hypothetical protein